ncbi:DUF190 domain-containing protein [Alginatibacterium sediminis]|uniref:DUF190 domain-containing protein n=1 Tax=Alginatibacterium sediminis TaxID=2164068 RepID=A0A420EMY1_9ALTE|nr:DUF190 domain-containing protein [Alginatibacterium sediminis]RKF22069.1 DUF190 domain-containing protein [Alginatibacterium sediminis]
MQGFYVTFFTEQNRKHQGKPIGEWLIQKALELGLEGATMSTMSEGFGHDHKLHSAHFIDLSDQPVKVMLASHPEGISQLMDAIKQSNLNVAYVKTPVEFGMTLTA